jgi:hypothetical protein
MLMERSVSTWIGSGAHMPSPLLDTAVDELHKVKRLADKAIAQLEDDKLWTRIDPDANSVAVVMRHMAGNMRSRWTDFLTSDGEKADRQRDQEFEDIAISRSELLAEWEDGWQRVFAALGSITDDRLADIVYIRQEPHTIFKALIRQLAHYAGHSYQILLLAKHLQGAQWQSLSIPRGQSDAFNARMIAEQRRLQP